MTDLERGISLIWVVDSYWRTISTTHMGLSAGLVDWTRESMLETLQRLSLSYENMNPEDEMIIIREHEPG